MPDKISNRRLFEAITEDGLGYMAEGFWPDAGQELEDPRTQELLTAAVEACRNLRSYIEDSVLEPDEKKDA